MWLSADRTMAEFTGRNGRASREADTTFDSEGGFFCQTKQNGSAASLVDAGRGEPKRARDMNFDKWRNYGVIWVMSPTSHLVIYSSFFCCRCCSNNRYEIIARIPLAHGAAAKRPIQPILATRTTPSPSRVSPSSPKKENRFSHSHNVSQTILEDESMIEKKHHRVVSYHIFSRLARHTLIKCSLPILEDWLKGDTVTLKQVSATYSHKCRIESVFTQ